MKNAGRPLLEKMYSVSVIPRTDDGTTILNIVIMPYEFSIVSAESIFWKRDNLLKEACNVQINWIL